MNDKTTKPADDEAAAKARAADEQAKRDAAAKDKAPARTGRAAKADDAAAAEDAPAWMQPDYTGPLDVSQAEWRRRHIKPAHVAVTKGAGDK